MSRCSDAVKFFSAISLLSLSGMALAANVVKLNENDIQLLNQFSIASALTHTVGHSLAVKSERTDIAGIKHTRFEQRFNNIPVYGHEVITHGPRTRTTGMQSNQMRVNGQLVQNIEQDVATIDPAQYDAKAMLESLKNKARQTNTMIGGELAFDNEQAELVYFIDSNEKARLAYHISFFQENINGGQPSRPDFIIDANTKEVLQQGDRLTFEQVGRGPGGNKKVGRYEYGTDHDGLDITVNNNKCSMVNSQVKTVDLNHSSSNGKLVEFDCFTYDGDETNGAYSPTNDAHFFGSVVFDMFDKWYNTAPLHFQLMMRVHYGYSYENAFWNGSSMTFGDGRSRFYPLVSLDVIAHEVSHGFTEQHSNLYYSGHSGGMNEAFSDMAGKAAEFFMRGHNTWGIGDDITKGPNPLRYMEKPSKDGRSIDRVQDYYRGLDVHYSSGVFNKAFYHMATAEGWDTQKAFDVMVEANSNYWTQFSKFDEGAWGVVQAAKDLGYDVEAVKDAFEQVGLDCSDTGCAAQLSIES